MNDNGSVTDFFYNIIPGSLFLFALKPFIDFDIFLELGFDPNDSALRVFGYIVLSLFLGFFFQCLTKVCRGKTWNKRAFQKIRCDEDNHPELKAVFLDIFGKDYEKDKCINRNKIFYLMDNSLRAESPAFMPTHFSMRFAFWANIFWGSLFLFLFGLIVPPLNSYFLLYLLFLTLFSLWMADEHLKNFYDSILKSYFMTKVK